MAGAFFRHRGLIAFSAGGAMVEAALLSFLTPAARPLAPQVTALPPLAAYHDLRWLFAFNQSWLGFAAVLALLVLARSAVDAVLVLLAWPRGPSDGVPQDPKTIRLTGIPSTKWSPHNPYIPYMAYIPNKPYNAKAIQSSGTVGTPTTVDAPGAIGVPEAVDVGETIDVSGTIGAPRTVDSSETIGASGTIDASGTIIGPEIPSVPRPRFVASVLSCAVLTVLVGLVMSPVVTLMFGVALVPFSWPYLAAVPILLGTAIALSQGGVGQSWWRRLPPMRTATWVVATFLILSLASVLMTHLDTPGAVAVAGLAGVMNARAWYGLTTTAVRRSVERPPHPWHWRATMQRTRRALLDRTSWVPMAPLAAVMVIVLTTGLARLAFTGTVRFASGPSAVAAGTVLGDGQLAAIVGSKGPARAHGSGVASGAGPKARGAVLVIEGFGSSCCHDVGALRAAEPGMLVRQFSYLGLNAAGQPISYGPAAGDLPIQVLGDRMATQVQKLYQQAHTPVDIVAESEGTLGLYAMLARHPHVPVGSLVLLSPIVEPGQLGQAGRTVPGQALITLNTLVGGMSPFGSEGAQELIDSVSEVGATYFARVSRDTGLPWLAIVPLADAVTLPACPWPQNVIFVEAFHGGLLGDASVRQMVETFLASGSASADSKSQQHLRTAAQVIAAAATAWRMPELHPDCPR